MNIRRCQCVLIIAVGSIVMSRYACAEGDEVSIDDRRILTEMGKDYSVCAATLGVSNDVVVVGAIVDRSVSTNCELALWSMRSGEKERRLTKLQFPDQPAALDALTRRYVRDLCLIPNGEILAIVEMLGGNPIIARVSATGKVLSYGYVSTELQNTEQIIAMQIVSTSDGMYEVGGSVGDNGFVMKVNSEGKAVWHESIVVSNQQTSVYDVVAAKDGEVAVVANAGRYNKFGFGESEVLICKYDIQGKKIAVAKVVGRQGSVCYGEDGSVTLVYDKSKATGQDIWMAHFDKTLKLIWSNPIVVVAKGFSSPFRVVEDGGGRCVVAGVKDFHIWMSLRGRNGEEVWSHVGKEGPPAWYLARLASNRHGWAIISSCYDVRERPPKYQVEIIRCHSNEGK